MDDTTTQPTLPAGALPHDAVVLGRFSAAHLGDTLCTSALPRLIHGARGRPVYVQEDPVLRAVFTANPHVAGFVAGEFPKLDHRMRGAGHVLQRLQQGLELPIEPMPRPEIHLTQTERRWATDERERWGHERPACVLSTSAVTDAGNASRVDWFSVAEALRRRFTVVQPVLSEPPLPGTISPRGLSLRQYMALIAAADFFVGATSGGSHVAAAFGVPALVVSWRALLDPLRFPVSGLGIPAAFLYPQQWHLAAEDLATGRFRVRQLEQVLADMQARGRAGRDGCFANHPASPCGFTPWKVRPVVRVRNRFVRVPAAG